MREPVVYTGRRDPRLVTTRRGGLLDDPTHRLLARWAADCADHVLAIFTAANSDDPRPAQAIAVARSWAAMEATMAEARRAAAAAHAAARTASGAAQFAARAAGHAAATAHMADHELGSAYYALLAIGQCFPGDAGALDRERHWQLAALTPPIAELVRDDMRERGRKFRGLFEM